MIDGKLAIFPLDTDEHRLCTQIPSNSPVFLSVDPCSWPFCQLLPHRPPFLSEVSDNVEYLFNVRLMSVTACRAGVKLCCPVLANRLTGQPALAAVPEEAWPIRWPWPARTHGPPPAASRHATSRRLRLTGGAWTRRGARAGGPHRANYPF